MPRPIIQDNLNATRLMRFCKEHENDVCKVLDKDEEQKLIAELRHDPAKLQEALIMHNVALVFKLAAQYMASSRSFDETVHNGLYGLCYAAKKYDIDQTKTKFSTYAYNWIYKYVWGTYWADNLNEQDFINQSISLNAAISEYSSSSKSDSDNGDMGNYLENHLDPNQTGAIASPEDALQNNAMTRLFAQMKDYMLTSDFTDTDRLVFDKSFVDAALPLRRISSDFNIPLREVKSSYQKILDLMKAKLAEQNVTSMDDVF